ncbi:MAG: WD40/YVTN/BNR-like repeat-containing protein [Candidatus Sulfotelmatobacter sp.]
MKSSLSISCAVAVLLGGTSVLANSQAPAPYRFDAATVSGLPARNIGSATMSGRIAAVDAVEEDGRITVFVGAASGGVWKSVNGGTTYKPVFDREDVQSIGAVAIDPSNSKTVWVGTGEAWMRNSVSVGDGVYKSTDGGENWTNVGLKDSEHIAKILINPSDGNNVLACASGHLWDDNDERGVYQTTDGGKSWNKVLAGANGSSGCAMIARSKQDPKTIYAAMWDFQRQGWTFRSGGPGSGLFKSTDGGAHWSEITDANAKGLPPKPYGRIAVQVAESKPNVVYANIEAEKGRGLYRSDDAGATWTKLDASNWMVWRPFYFGNLIVDPKNENKIFKPDLILLLSNDGGKTFNVVSSAAHGDFHDVWIDPKNTNIVIAGDDGGLWRSEDGGNRWKHQMNLPVAQFYHVSVDNADPYHVYGGLQDNSSWVGDSSFPGGIANANWENMYGGDGFWMFEDPSDPDYLYAEAQGGEIGRVNRHTHETRDIHPWPNYNEKKLRFNWNTPIHMSPNEKGTIYIGAQYLFRSRDHGQSWERISPDLTTNDPEKQKQEESGGVTVDNSSAEMYTTIYSISESPKNGQIIWVGTDDGNVQITRDGAKTWTNVVGNIKDLGKNSWVSTIEASRFDEGTAYATFDRHTFGDKKPYVYKTTDYGQTWTALPAQESGVRGFAHVIKEDAVDRNVLFLGTEFGLWISVDGGQRWAQYKGTDFPAAPVDDIAIQARESDVVLATHGRGIWIIDDVSPLRALTPELMTKEAALIPGRAAIQYFDVSGGWPEGDESFHGRNRPFDAQITYYQKGRHIFGDLKIEIFDQDGKLVDTVAGSKHRGLNRAAWGMHVKPPAVAPAASALFEAAQGPRVLPGTYTVKLTKGDQTYTEKLDVVLDPRAKFSVEDRKAQFELSMKIYKELEHMTYGVESIEGVRNAANARASKLAEARVPESNPLRKSLQQLADDCETLRGKIVATKEGGMITGEERIRELLGQLYGAVMSYDGKPTDYQVARTESLGHELQDVIDEFQAKAQKELPAINAGLKKKKMEGIAVLVESDWQKKKAAESAAAAGAGMRTGERERVDND